MSDNISSEPDQNRCQTASCRQTKTMQEIKDWAKALCVLDAAKRFYEHFGFRELRDHPRHLYLPLSQAALGLE